MCVFCLRDAGWAAVPRGESFACMNGCGKKGRKEGRKGGAGLSHSPHLTQSTHTYHYRSLRG